MQRDEFSCQYCKEKSKSLHVHHKTYEFGNLPWDYEIDNFITLCEDCHNEEEHNKILFNYGIKYLLKNNVNYYELNGIINNKFLEVYKNKEVNNG